jgi:hypothetical protein
VNPRCVPRTFVFGTSASSSGERDLMKREVSHPNDCVRLPAMNVLRCAEASAPLIAYGFTENRAVQLELVDFCVLRRSSLLSGFDAL